MNKKEQWVILFNLNTCDWRLSEMATGNTISNIHIFINIPLLSNWSVCSQLVANYWLSTREGIVRVTYCMYAEHSDRRVADRHWMINAKPLCTTMPNFIYGTLFVFSLKGIPLSLSLFLWPSPLLALFFSSCVYLIFTICILYPY